MFNVLNWWLTYAQGAIDAYKARLGASLRTPALAESVDRRFPARPFGLLADHAPPPRTVLGVDLAGRKGSTALATLRLVATKPLEKTPHGLRGYRAPAAKRRVSDG